MKGFRTKKITLPGGKVLEIVYFHEPNDDEGLASEASQDGAADAIAEAAGLTVTAEAEVATEAPSVVELHVCPECAGELVYPIEWEEHRGDSWQLSRRCPSCEWTGTGEFEQAAVDHFDDVLSEGTETLLSSLRSMVRANMEEDVEAFIAAINADQILPIDF